MVFQNIYHIGDMKSAQELFFSCIAGLVRDMVGQLLE